MVRDDKASRDVWLSPESGALAGLEKGAIAIESSTLTPGWIQKLGAAFAERERTLLEAPVVGSRPQEQQAELTRIAEDERHQQLWHAICEAQEHGTIAEILNTIRTTKLPKKRTQLQDNLLFFDTLGLSMKIAFIPVPAPGHLNPTTILARKLASRGHEVAVVGVLDVKPLIEAIGLPFIPCCEDVYPAATLANSGLSKRSL
jgi:hypothetical protein